MIQMLFLVFPAGVGLPTLVITHTHVAYSSTGRAATTNYYYHDGGRECGFFRHKQEV